MERQDAEDGACGHEPAAVEAAVFVLMEGNLLTLSKVTDCQPHRFCPSLLRSWAWKQEVTASFSKAATPQPEACYSLKFSLFFGPGSLHGQYMIQD